MAELFAGDAVSVDGVVAESFSMLLSSFLGRRGDKLKSTLTLFPLVLFEFAEDARPHPSSDPSLLLLLEGLLHFRLLAGVLSSFSSIFTVETQC